jgi:hypothetical protein
MGIIVVNGISLLMFILVILVFVMSDSIAGMALGVLFTVVWLVFTIAANIHMLKGKKSTERLKDSDRGRMFERQINRLNTQYESIMSREEYFKHNVDEGSGLANLYEDIKQQAESNIDSAIGFIDTYDYYTRPEPIYLNRLCAQGDVLVNRFNRLVEKMVDIDTNLTSLDMKYVDDVIECMNEMRDDAGEGGSQERGMM